ncbi:MAG: transporter, partial [Treponema sp.]|nr:transporter [Treponema sp.]
HIQLITTTHETRIMTHDLVRRDELWLADTNEDASTNLFSLESKQVRIDKVLEENYLEGIWGGVPRFE